jgi:hypothetical protein
MSPWMPRRSAYGRVVSNEYIRALEILIETTQILLPARILTTAGSGIIVRPGFAQAYHCDAPTASFILFLPALYRSSEACPPLTAGIASVLASVPKIRQSASSVLRISIMLYGSLKQRIMRSFE